MSLRISFDRHDFDSTFSVYSLQQRKQIIVLKFKISK